VPVTRRKFTVILEPEEDGGYSVHCPALPGCVSQGDNRQEALENVKEAIQLVLETLEQEGIAAEQVLEAFQERAAPPYKESPDLIAEEVLHILKERHQDGLPLTIETAEVELLVQVPA
jgi:predicted RNase H-like HicB family nuclease